MDGSMDVLVVGGGPTGLAAALLAARAGHGVTLVEAGERLGGMAASISVAGQRVDLGSHRLHPSAPPRVRALLDELLGADLQVRTRNGRLRVAGSWARFPLDPADLLGALPIGLAARIGTDLLAGAVRSDSIGPRDSYADVVRQRLGRTVLEHFHGPYAAKLYGTDPAVIDGDVARRRIALTGLGDVLARLRRSRQPSGSVFLYPRLGYGQVTDRLAEEAVGAGVEIRTGTTVTEVAPAGGGARVRSSDGAVHDVGRVLWTAPPGALAVAAGRPPVPLEHRALALVYLVVDRGRWLPWDAHYVPTPGVSFVRLSEPRNYRDGPDPAGTTVLCAEVPCSVGDATWVADDAELAAAVTAGIDRLGLPVPTVVGHRVVRLPRVYPLLRIGEAARLREQLASLRDVPGVTLLGRQGLGVADNLHHVLAMAMAAVDCLRPDGGFDDAAWDRHLAAFARHVVED